jgi:hypothetical protein
VRPSPYVTQASRPAHLDLDTRFLWLANPALQPLDIGGYYNHAHEQRRQALLALCGALAGGFRWRLVVVALVAVAQHCAGMFNNVSKLILRTA